MRVTTVRGALLALAFAASALSAHAQGRPLGPADGRELPPLDTGRVVAGTAAPDFTLESKDGGTVTLSQFRGKRKIGLVFYRGHW